MTDVARQLAELGVATLHEAMGRVPVSRHLRLLVGEPFAGKAVTVTLPAGDNLGVHLAIEAANPGEVACIASAGQGAYGVLGDLLLETARAKGLAGLVIDDGIRDLATLEEPPSLAARTVSPRGTIKRRLRQPVGDPVAIDGLWVRSGDWLICDRDGVCVVPADQLESGLQAANRREAKEAELRKAFRRGERSSKVLGLAPPASQPSVT